MFFTGPLHKDLTVPKDLSEDVWKKIIRWYFINKIIFGLLGVFILILGFILLSGSLGGEIEEFSFELLGLKTTGKQLPAGILFSILGVAVILIGFSEKVRPTSDES